MWKNLFDTCVVWSCVTRCRCGTTSSTLFTVYGISELSVQNRRDSGEILSKDRYKTTSGFLVISPLSQLWEKKNYCERRNELSSWRPVALPNRHIHLCLFKLEHDGLALLSGVMYILSGENLAGVYSTTRRLRDQNTTQVDNRQGRAGTLCIQLLHLPPWLPPPLVPGGGGHPRLRERTGCGSPNSDDCMEKKSPCI